MKFNTSYETCEFGGAVDENGDPVQLSKWDYPYSYDAFLVARLLPQKMANHAIYSDRLLQWDYAKTRSLMKKHFTNDGDYYTNRSPESIQNFLRERLDNPNLQLVSVLEGCNVGNGYPYWVFFVRS